MTRQRSVGKAPSACPSITLTIRQGAAKARSGVPSVTTTVAPFSISWSSGKTRTPGSQEQDSRSPTRLTRAPAIEVAVPSRATARCRPYVVKLKLDLHDIYNRGDDIERALRGIIEEAIEKRVRLVEIIPGKGNGQLKKRVLRFLDQKDIKALYDRVEKDSHNFGRVFVHFRPK
jgi:hypothetical protein